MMIERWNPRSYTSIQKERRMNANSVILATLFLALTSSSLLPVAAGTQSTPDSRYVQLARDIFKELIEINTTDSSGSTTPAAEAMAVRLRAAGFPAADVQVLGPDSRKGNLVARLRGTGARKPVLLLAHLDVVEAHREDWSVDPFKFLEQDGYFYGRGTSDIKSGCAILAANLIRLKEEGFQPDRDLIVALTADEEGGRFNGVDWLLKNRRDLIDSTYCLNVDGGGGAIKDGRHLLNELQTSEKTYLSFRLEVTDRGGHSSLPVKDNAIYHLASGLTRLAQFEFPTMLNETTRAFFERMSRIEGGQTGRDMIALLATPPDPKAVARLAEMPLYNAQMRTTCVATRLEAGHADNALPQRARSLVNCRLIPEDSPEGVRKILERILADERITVTAMNEARVGPRSSIVREVMEPAEQITSQLWPGVPVVPVMSTGGTDGLYLRMVGMPTYGISGVFHDVSDIRAHGRDERIGVKEFFDGLEFMYRLVKALSHP
jgi:acetylornithine deacetylase/succinyl-diaminopimelate desuccinylase-like protein